MPVQPDSRLDYLPVRGTTVAPRPYEGQRDICFRITGVQSGGQEALQPCRAGDILRPMNALLAQKHGCHCMIMGGQAPQLPAAHKNAVIGNLNLSFHSQLLLSPHS
jgi:hypothetical protein